MYYGGVRVEYTAYQDDVGKPSNKPREAQIHMTKIAFLFEDKGLDAHPDKTAYILFKGNKKNVAKMEKELELNPIKFGEFTMSRKNQDKYLGQILHEDGLRASVAATVADRTGKLKGAIFEIRSIIEEYSMQTMGGMMAAKILLKRAILPSFLSGSCNWTGISKKSEDDCDELIYLFWRVMFKVTESTPKISLIAETNSMRTKWRIWKEKLMHIIRIQSQETTSLARQNYEKQLQLKLPGLATEVSDISKQINIPDVNYYKVKKEDIEENIFFHHYKDMKLELEKSKKLQNIKHQDFTKEQSYLEDKSIDRCRTRFRIRTEMCETFKDNFRSKYRTLDRGEEDKDPGLNCEDCSQFQDSQSHCMICPAWTEARDRLDLEDMNDVVTYFRRVLQGREEKRETIRRRNRTQTTS